jgi:signal transduction histidine kinase
LLDGYGGDLTKVQTESLENVSHQSELLLKLISDILTLGRLEAGKLVLDIRKAPLDELFRHVRAYAGQLNQQSAPEMFWDIEEDLPPLTTDHVKLEEILQNLIGNAYKFTTEGRITVRVGNLEAEGRIEFVVEDTGMGIDVSEVNRVFDAFHQSPEAHKGNLGGVGLGLSIVKKYLDLMEGDIRVESLPGQGSRFVFTLPHTI